MPNIFYKENVIRENYLSKMEEDNHDFFYELEYSEEIKEDDYFSKKELERENWF